MAKGLEPDIGDGGGSRSLSRWGPRQRPQRHGGLGLSVLRGKRRGRSEGAGGVPRQSRPCTPGQPAKSPRGPSNLEICGRPCGEGRVTQEGVGPHDTGAIYGGYPAGTAPAKKRPSPHHRTAAAKFGVWYRVGKGGGRAAMRLDWRREGEGNAARRILGSRTRTRAKLDGATARRSLRARATRDASRAIRLARWATRRGETRCPAVFEGVSRWG